MPRAKAKAKEIPINEIIVKEENTRTYPSTYAFYYTPSPSSIRETAKEEKPTKLQAENGYITDTTGEV